MNLSAMSELLAPSPVVSRDTYEVSMLILLAPLLTMSVIGVVTNVINMAVFVKQGVASDSTTLSLFALALSDILGCIFMLPQPVCFFLEEFVVTDNVFVNNCVVLITMPATAEIIGHIPFILNTLILWVPDPDRNKTLTAFNYQTPIGSLLYRLSNLIESNILTTAAMFIITMATVAIVTQVKTSSAWRNTLTNKSGLSLKKSETPKNKISIKDRETVRVVLSVTVLFLICLAMSHFPGLAMYVIPEFSLDGYNRGLFHLCYTFKFNLDALNASVNFFFYLKQSSKFRKTCYSLFRTV
ncbi:hypothetical protein Btru_050462 [Bulinus truncatus]|nr:hypothetical protein Btru_050462 [Bulinus truncatus]